MPDASPRPNASTSRARVVIAGGSGFVGRALADQLKTTYDVTVLSRSGKSTSGDLRGVACDLFSLLQTERAVSGADYAIYLVHSMNPTARLTQAAFEDLDLIMADNFARACATAAVRQIVYLGGLIPDTTQLSRHLASRLETERALAADGTPVTAVRAGLIIGGGGSSFQILFNVVKRLPVMICPLWTRSKTQPVALVDAVRAIQENLGHGEAYNTVMNIGGPEIVSYQTLMKKTAAALGRRLRILTVPLNSYTLSRLWVQLFSGSSAALVAPLVESLKDSMIAEPNYLGVTGVDCDTALREAVAEIQQERAQASRTRAVVTQSRAVPPKKIKDVRSVQRIPLPAGKSARWASRRYALWLDRVTGRLLDVHFDRRTHVLQFRVGPLLLLELSLAENRSASDRVLFYITDGVLLRRTPREPAGRLEFRAVFGGEFMLAAIHDFRPGLPWIIYNLSQAQIHLFVMRRFAAHLGRYHRRKKI